MWTFCCKCYQLLSYQILRITYILQRVDALGRLLDLTTNDFRNKLGCELGEGAADGLVLHDIGHLLPDSADLRRARVRSFLDLVRTSLRESDGEQTNKVVIGCLHSDVGFNECLPLAHERAQLIGSKIQSVEVGQAVFPLNLVDTQLDLAEGVVFIVLKIGERDFENPAFKRVVGILQTSGAVYESLPHALKLISNLSPSYRYRRKRTQSNFVLFLIGNTMWNILAGLEGGRCLVPSVMVL